MAALKKCFFIVDHIKNPCQELLQEKEKCKEELEEKRKQFTFMF